jgi:hypothetical protein
MRESVQKRRVGGSGGRWACRQSASERSAPPDNGRIRSSAHALGRITRPSVIDFESGQPSRHIGLTKCVPSNASSRVFRSAAASESRGRIHQSEGPSAQDIGAALGHCAGLLQPRTTRPLLDYGRCEGAAVPRLHADDAPRIEQGLKHCRVAWADYSAQAASRSSVSPAKWGLVAVRFGSFACRGRSLQGQRAYSGSSSGGSSAPKRRPEAQPYRDGSTKRA